MVFSQPNSASGSQAAGTNGHGQPAGFLSSGNVSNLNQNVPNNSNMPNMMPSGIPVPGGSGIGGFSQHDAANFGSSRPGANNFAAANAAAASGGGFPGGHNTHNMGFGNSFGAPQAPTPGGPHHPVNDGAGPGMHQNSLNSSIQFGSRMASQNQGYHPYRRS